MNTKFIHVAILFLCLLSFRVIAQNELTGKVVNYDAAHNTNTPIRGALLEIPDLKVSAITDSDGVYSFHNLPKGTYLVTARSLGCASDAKSVKAGADATLDFSLIVSVYEIDEAVITGASSAISNRKNPQPITEVSTEYLNENSATNVIDAISKVPGVSAMTDGQSISKPMIRGLGYNRVLTEDDGVELMDQAWFDEFGIEVDPDKVSRAEILRGPASLAYGSDAVAGVVNLIPEAPLAPGQREGEILFNYQTNNGLINNMLHLAGADKNGFYWSGRIDNIMAHSYQDPADGYALNTQFSNFNMDGTIGIRRKWGYSQFKSSYFDMATGIVDGTRDSATGVMEMQVAYPGLNGGAPTYVIPTGQEARSYTPFVINQRIRQIKEVWDNSIAVGEGHITATFSFQRNLRQETNDPTQPNTPDIVYASSAATYDLRYVSKQYGGFNFSTGANGAYQESESLGTVMLVPNYNFFQVGAFAIGNYQVGKLSLSGGIRFDNRTFTAYGHWIDTTANEPQVPVPANTPGAFPEFNQFTSNFSGVSGSIGATYSISRALYIKANVARGYRAPNVEECAADGVHDGTVIYEIGDNHIQPETNLEEDLTFGISSRDITFEGTVFNNSFNNFIYLKGLRGANGQDSLSNLLSVGGSLFPEAPVFMYASGAAQLYGGEALLDIHPYTLPWIELNATLSYVDGGLVNVPDSIKYLPFVPPLRVTADLKFHFKKLGNAVKNAYVKVGMLSVAQQNHVYLGEAADLGLSTAETPQEYAASQEATAGYTLLNAGLGGDLQNHGRTFCKLYITGTNLLNTVYMDYMSRFKYYPVDPVTGRVGVFNMGRNISFKVIIPFDFSKSKQ